MPPGHGGLLIPRPREEWGDWSAGLEVRIGGVDRAEAGVAAHLEKLPVALDDPALDPGVPEGVGAEAAAEPHCLQMGVQAPAQVPHRRPDPSRFDAFGAADLD